MRKDDALKLSMGRVDARYHHTFEPRSSLHIVSQVPGEFDVTAHINAQGFRGPEMTVEKTEGVRRVFLVGDSFTFGVGAADDETIPARLAQCLASGPVPAETVNAGRGSTSPLIYYLRLRDEVPKYRPDVVVMMLDFSDLWEDWNFEKNIVRGRDGEIAGLDPNYEYGKFRVWNFLRSNSIFASWLHSKVVRSFDKIRKLGVRRYFKEAVLGGKRAKALIAAQGGDTISHDGRLFLRGSGKREEITKHFRRTAKYILMARDVVRSNGARFVLAMYPYGIQVGPEQWGKGRVFWGFEGGKVYDDPFSFDLVAEFAKENGIPFINFLPDLRAHADETLYFPHDGHFTPVANKIVAQALSRNPLFQEALTGENAVWEKDSLLHRDEGGETDL